MLLRCVKKLGIYTVLCLFTLSYQLIPCWSQEEPAALARPTSQDSTAEKSDKAAEAENTTEAKPQKKETEGWRPLLPQQGLEGWEITDFGTQSEVRRDGGQLIMEKGDPLNGVTYQKKDFPKDNFEISLQAQRIEGNDFLCGLTFPVGDEFCSFIAGGWGGSLVGLSSVDGFDASENATSTYFEFENGKWYEFRISVDPEFIRAFIDGKEFFRQERELHEFSTRIEVFSSQPLGLCAFESKVAVRDFKWRPLTAEKPETEDKTSGTRDVNSPVKPIQ